MEWKKECPTCRRKWVLHAADLARLRDRKQALQTLKCSIKNVVSPSPTLAADSAPGRLLLAEPFFLVQEW